MHTWVGCIVMSFDWFTSQGVRLPWQQRQDSVRGMSIGQQHCVLHHTSSGYVHSTPLCGVILAIVAREQARCVSRAGISDPLSARYGSPVLSSDPTGRRCGPGNTEERPVSSQRGPSHSQ